MNFLFSNDSFQLFSINVYFLGFALREKKNSYIHFVLNTNFLHCYKNTKYRI